MPGLGQGTTPSDGPVVDTAEQVYISSLALLKVNVFIPYTQTILFRCSSRLDVCTTAP